MTDENDSNDISDQTQDDSAPVVNEEASVNIPAAVLSSKMDKY